MSAVDVCPDDAPATEIAGGSRFRPQWLRPLTFVAVLALHAALLIVVKGQPAPLTPLDAIAVTLEPLGDAPEDQQKQDEIKPVEAPPPPPPPPLPVEQAQLTAPPPDVEAPQAIPLPVEQPKPIVKPKPRPVVEQKDDRPTPAEMREQKRKREEAADKRRKAQEARREARRGTALGEPDSGMSRGDYAGLLLAELRSHQFYPASARAEGVVGSVGVAFTVGASGRVVSQSITRSSGNAALDGAARAMMSAIHAPPPPGGSFSTSTSIRFHLN